MYYYNYDLYRQVKEKRKELSLPITETQIELTDHELLNQKLLNKETGKVYNVEKAFRCYYLGIGFYESILIENNGSHGIVFLKNEFQQKFDDTFEIINNRKEDKLN